MREGGEREREREREREKERGVRGGRERERQDTGLVVFCKFLLNVALHDPKIGCISIV